MKNNPVGWFEIYVQEMERARRFYEAVLQLKLERLPGPEIEMWAFPMQQEAAGAAGALVKMDGFPSGGNSTLIYFVCDDCAVEQARVSDNGGRVHQPKSSIGDYGNVSLVCDPDGNMFGLHSMK